MFSRLQTILACALILSGAHAFAEGAACCERPASRTSLLTAKPGQGSAVTSSAPAKCESTECSTTGKAKPGPILSLLLGAVWVNHSLPR